MSEENTVKNHPSLAPDAADSLPMRGYQVVLLLAVVLGAILVSQTVFRRGGQAGPPPPADPAAQGVVLLVIDRGEGEPTEGAVRWQGGMTVYDVLQAAPMNWPGNVQASGEGEMIFVESIGGLANEGVDGRNWLYSVNGVRGEVGAGAQLLAAGDRVLWAFAESD